MSTSTPRPSKTDLMYEVLYNPAFAPVPSPTVRVKTTVVHEKPSYLMKNHATGTYYDLDELTNSIWHFLDGKRTVSEIVEETQKLDPQADERTVLEMLLFFAESNLLASALEVAPRKRFKVVSPFETNYTLVRHSNEFFQSLNSKVKPIFKSFLLWAIIALIVLSALLFAGEFISIYGKKANFEVLGSSVVGFFFYYFVTLAPVIAIHEISHGLTLAHYGGQPGEMGTGFFYFSPMFYIETTDAWGLRRLHRIMVYLAGNLSTLFIGAAVVVIRLFVHFPDPAGHILTMVAFYCFSISLINFAPPFETDGYYVLADVVNIPTLRRDSYSYLGSLFRRALGKPAKTEILNLTTRKKRIFLMYAVLSVAWVLYIVFQSSVFLIYMGQDVTFALANIAQAVISSQAIQLSVVIIAVASTVYFGMQVMGYGLLFSAAVKKAFKKPLKVEAIHDRNLAVFAYLPPNVPESVSNGLRAKLEMAAKRLTPVYEIKQVGRSCIAILRLGGTNMANIQLKEHLRRMEHEFISIYQHLINDHKDIFHRSTGIYSPDKIKLTEMFDQIAGESSRAGNPTARPLMEACREKQKETLLCLLNSAFGTVWTIEVQPAQQYDMQKELVRSLLLDDLTLTDLYGDTESFKKQTVYGFDSIARLAAETDRDIRKGLAQPDKYQCIILLQPVRSRIIIIGRTEQIEKNIPAFAPLFITYAWSGYLDNLLRETCFKLSSLRRARFPTVKEISEMDVGELSVLSKDLSAFEQNRELIERSVQASENHLEGMSQNLQQIRANFESSTSSKMQLSDTLFNVNIENLAKLPSRIRNFREEWETISKRVKKIRDQIEKEHDSRRPTIENKKRRTLKIYPFVVALSLVLFILGFQSGLEIWRLTLLSVASVLQVCCWLIVYRTWTSFHRVTKYPSQAFNTTHLFLLAITEAVYAFATTEDILILPQ